MKKIRKQITDDLYQITVVDDTGEELTYLNGVIKLGFASPQDVTVFALRMS